MDGPAQHGSVGWIDDKGSPCNAERGDGRIEIVLRAGGVMYFEPIQLRDPAENGRKVFFSSLSKRESYSG